MVSNDVCVVSADAGGINDTVRFLLFLFAKVKVILYIHRNASMQYSAPMSAVTNRFGQGSISEDKCQSTLCTGDISFVEKEVQLSSFQQTVSFSDKLCDINDAWLCNKYTQEAMCFFLFHQFVKQNSKLHV